ncbi:MAG: J domain-containing protein [Chloroflexota bacterium]
MSIPDPYKVLQVDPEAEDDVIEAAYRLLAKRYHPDVAPGPDAQARMVAINQARDILRDPVKRAAVDRARTRAAATSARVVAADGKAHAGQGAHVSQAAHAARSARHAPAGGADRRSGPGQAWGFPGMADPDAGDFERPGPAPAASWTPGRSSQGSGYDARTMGASSATGGAGLPPGNPSGTIVTFGRYAGWTLGEIARSDLEYLEWLDRMPIGRGLQAEIDALLRQHGRRTSSAADSTRGLFRRR